MKKNITVGFDPWLHSIKEIETQKEILQKSIRLKEVSNLIDAVWLGKPIEEPIVNQAKAYHLT